MLTVSNLAKSYGNRTLFRDVTMQLSPGRRIALIGGNGVGKTTICEIIVGLQESDEGEVSKPNDYRIGYLPQELMEAWTGTVLDEVLRGSGEILELEAELRRLEAVIGAASGDEASAALHAYGVAQSRFEALGGYQIEAEGRRILGGLGFSTTDMDRPLTEMSGGWQMRAVLARLLLQKPDVLVMDEPTNHLDVDSVAWLEQQLVAWPGALLFVSHDRDFIDTVAERCVEVAWGTTSEYVGGFVEFIVAREERLQALEAAANRQAKEVARVERFIERFRYKATKARQVQSRVKTLQRLERIEVPKVEDLKLRFAFPDPPRSSRLVIEIVGATIGYDDLPVVSEVDLVIERGQKLALIGPNGAGKTTLLKAILGQLEPQSGTVKLGANVDVAYFAQHQVDALDMNSTVEQEFRRAVGEQPKNRNLRTVLGSFGFSGDAVDRRVGDLSGGERTRLALAESMCNPVNLLVLDEPSNHLDLPSCDILEDALQAYPGTVLLVSHDRYLVRNTVEEVVEVRDGKVTHHLDVDETVLNPSGSAASSTPMASSLPTTRRQGPPLSSNRRGAKASGQGPKHQNGSGGGGSNQRKAQRRDEAERRNATGRATRDLRKRIERLERQATKAEEEVTSLEQKLADPEVYADKALMNDLINDHERAQSKATRLVKEWEQAAEELEAATT
ncbi:MAG: ABC-F family ATP-binding cassette domain-containing protein [Actinomycetia bacterium]|nr:ABC-F family ATP-binding cassette domain-containing protein [Actinomycetes bacterium]MCP5035282.1 ABC-F family ATP-binding cassette domain-containing protein [Actinomycetes bacterium]